MPLSGEAIRMMNYIDDISTTLRRILALAPTLSAEERKRVGEYLKVSSPSADEAMAALEPQIDPFWEQARRETRMRG